MVLVERGDKELGETQEEMGIQTQFELKYKSSITHTCSLGRGTLGRSLCRTSRHSAWVTASAVWFSYNVMGGGKEDKESGEKNEHRLFKHSSHFEDKAHWSSEHVTTTFLILL